MTERSALTVILRATFPAWKHNYINTNLYKYFNTEIWTEDLQVSRVTLDSCTLPLFVSVLFADGL